MAALGVGSARRSLVARSQSGHFFVGPDNGLFTLVGDESGWNEVHVIKENAYRRKGSEDSYTFHGRDLYAYVGAQLAAGQLNFSGLGESIAPNTLVRLTYQKAEFANGSIKGNVPVLDPNYGNVWTNIPRALILSSYPKARKFKIRIDYKSKRVFEGNLPLVDSFSGVPHGTPLLYFNSLLNISVALNMANFAKTYHVGSGPDWTVLLTPVK
jgi:S-adenosylmethionine hydrolase